MTDRSQPAERPDNHLSRKSQEKPNTFYMFSYTSYISADYDNTLSNNMDTGDCNLDKT